MTTVSLVTRAVLSIVFWCNALAVVWLAWLGRFPPGPVAAVVAVIVFALLALGFTPVVRASAEKR